MPDSGRQHLQQLFDFAIEKGLKFIRKHSRFLMMEVPEMCYIMTLCNIMSSFLDFLSKHGGFGAPGKPFFSLCLIEFRVNRQQANFYSDVTLREAIRKHVSKNTYSDLLYIYHLSMLLMSYFDISKRNIEKYLNLPIRFPTPMKLYL